MLNCYSHVSCSVERRGVSQHLQVRTCVVNECVSTHRAMVQQNPWLLLCIESAHCTHAHSFGYGPCDAPGCVPGHELELYAGDMFMHG